MYLFMGVCVFVVMCVYGCTSSIWVVLFKGYIQVNIERNCMMEDVTILQPDLGEFGISR